jgi:hypothetical protein
MKKILIILTALTLAGCTYKPRDLDDLYVFAKHDETGLCFFGEDWDNDGRLDSGTAGNVPCTSEVEAWIEARK